MTCREAANLLPLFLDGELDPRQMRAVALHQTRCDTCENELRSLERLQEVISDSVHAQVDEIDFGQLWSVVERGIGGMRTPWWQRVRLWWEESEHTWVIRLPAVAAAAAIAVLAFLFVMRSPQPTTQPDQPHLAAVDNAATIDSLDTDVDSVAVLSDPETRTTVLWVSDDTTVGGDVP